MTDAISALGLEPGHYRLGDQDVEVTHSSAVLAGTNTLCGAIATQDKCVRNFKRSAGEEKAIFYRVLTLNLFLWFRLFHC